MRLPDHGRARPRTRHRVQAPVAAAHGRPLRQRKDGRWVYYRLAEHGPNPFAPGMLALVGSLAVEGDPVLEADRARLAAVRQTPLEVFCAPDGRAVVTAACCQGEC